MDSLLLTRLRATHTFALGVSWPKSPLQNFQPSNFGSSFQGALKFPKAAFVSAARAEMGLHKFLKSLLHLQQF